MSRDVRVHFLPSLFNSDELANGIAVVIDVLRASTTITHALAAEAKAVIPCETVTTARQMAANHGSENVVLGGERDGVLIDGFDLDNSPFNYTRQQVAQRTVVFTTTNGTKALLRSRQASRVLIGAFNNINTVLHVLIKDDRPIHLVCAGSDGTITSEDCLCAGAMASGLFHACPDSLATNDQGCMAMAFFESRARTHENFMQTIRTGRGGRNLTERKFQADIERAAEWDRFDLVPEFSVDTGQIRPMAHLQPLTTRWLAEPDGSPAS